MEAPLRSPHGPASGVARGPAADADQSLLLDLARCGEVEDILRAASLALSAGVEDELWWLDVDPPVVRCFLPQRGCEVIPFSDLDAPRAEAVSNARELDRPETLQLGAEHAKAVLHGLPLVSAGQRLATLCWLAPQRAPAEGWSLLCAHADLLSAAAERAVDRERLRRECARVAELEAVLGERLAGADSSRDLGAAAASMVHEIRNPLLAMTYGLRDLQARVALRQEDRELLGLVLAEAERVNRLARDFLGLARNADLAREPVELASLVRDTLTLLAEDPQLSGVALGWSAASALPEIRGDGDRLRQVLWNLVLNAARATGEGGQVAVGLEPLPPGRAPGVRITVDDDGPGVPPEARERVFAPFETGHASGTGLGLPLVRHVVSQHGGRAWIDDSPLGGARICIVLPA